MYFKSRREAGQKLAQELRKYRYQTCAVIALSDGGVVVAAEIAEMLKCVMMLLLTAPIKLPGESDPVAVINQDGLFTYNSMYSAGQLEEFTNEYYQYIEQAKLERLDEMHRLLGKGGLIRKDLLHGHNVIVVSDGFSSGFSLDAISDYLKPVKMKRLIVATPLASVAAVDRMHILTDEIHCLSVVENFMDINHYYEDNRLPNHETIISTIKSVVAKWQDTHLTPEPPKGKLLPIIDVPVASSHL